LFIYAVVAVGEQPVTSLEQVTDMSTFNFLHLMKEQHTNITRFLFLGFKTQSDK